MMTGRKFDRNRLHDRGLRNFTRRPESYRRFLRQYEDYPKYGRHFIRDDRNHHEYYDSRKLVVDPRSFDGKMNSS